MIKGVIRSYLINLFALYVTANYIGAFHLADGLKSLFIVGAGFTLLHFLVKPVMSLILGPLNFLTLGTIGLIIDSVILYALTLFFPTVNIAPWFFPGTSAWGFVIPAYNFNQITGTVLSAMAINVIRSTLQLLTS